MVEQQFCVLIVDDTLTNILILSKTLSSAGYRILQAKSGAEARHLAEQERPDIILMDIMMPEEDGFEVIQKLKNNALTSSIPVIFLTAVADIESKVKGFELGAVDFVMKPFHPAEVRARVKLHIKLSIATAALLKGQSDKLKQIENAQQELLVNQTDVPEAQFSCYYLSLEEAGGDFYDVFSINDFTYGYFVADVSGHDIASSFVTSAVKALLKQNCLTIYDPVESMKMVNEVLIDVLPPAKYLTAHYLTIDRMHNTARFVAMGHPPIIYCPVDGEAQFIEQEGDVLGMFHESLYKESLLHIKKGDRFVFYTDGLVEDDHSWGGSLGGLLDIVTQCRDIPLAEQADFITHQCFSGDRDPSDDIVVMVAEV